MDGPEPRVALACESRLVDIERAEVRRYTDPDQQAECPSVSSLGMCLRRVNPSRDRRPTAECSPLLPGLLDRLRSLVPAASKVQACFQA